MSNARRLTVSELRKDLPEILYRVLAKNETFTVLKHGQPFAVLSPITDPEENQEVNDAVRDGMATAVSGEDVVAGEFASEAPG